MRLILLLALASAAYGQIKLSKDLKLQKVAEDAWVVRHDWTFASNSVVLRMPGGEVVMIDTPCTSKATARLVEWIRDELKPSVLTAVNTHYHVDRLGGNGALRRLDIVSWGTTHTARLVKERGKLEATAPQDPLIPPEQLFDENQPIKLHGLEIFYPGAGHTPDNIVVWDPVRRILAGGCLIVGWPKLGYMREADPSAWLEALDKLDRLAPAIVVPGHGDRTDPELIESTRVLLRNYRR
ncbi:MAG TPA: MBL fold metallo-hydrolase [Bryobacteraceae bacterium]|nr:MBL fold metallo-hydrolase [Bryobacteraceae bacterium]